MQSASTSTAALLLYSQRTCGYCSWSSPTDQFVRKLKDGLGINMTMIKFFFFVPVQQCKPEVEFPPRGARSGGHDSCQAARTAAPSHVI